MSCYSPQWTRTIATNESILVCSSEYNHDALCWFIEFSLCMLSLPLKTLSKLPPLSNLLLLWYHNQKVKQGVCECNRFCTNISVTVYFIIPHNHFFFPPSNSEVKISIPRWISGESMIRTSTQTYIISLKIELCYGDST